MRVVIDIEGNGLKPDKIWLIVAKELESGRRHIFRNPSTDASARLGFLQLADVVDTWIGHNWLGYDYPVLERLIGLRVPEVAHKSIDTLIISKLVDYPRKGHSVESYGEEFGLPKGTHTDWSKYSLEMEDYCVRDVDITEKIYKKYARYISNPDHHRSILLEHEFQLVCNRLESNGFAFNTAKAQQLLEKVQSELATLDAEILSAFPARLKLIREVTPRETKHGTISLSSIPKALRQDISDMYVGAAFSYCSWSVFNPASHPQIISVLNQAGWKPIDKTETHKDVEREIGKLERSRKRDRALDLRLEELYSKYNTLKEMGWKVNEENLETLPPSAPTPARLLAKRILLESRRRTLTEWLGLVTPLGRIHGKFYGIGAWTHRMAHQSPNTANIPNAVKVSTGEKTLYGKELRSFWHAPRGRLLVGVDAEAIQLRIFAHLINDPALTEAIVSGKKSDGTDPHSLNRKYFGEFCKTRNAAKHSLYAIFFGGGPGKVAEIMACTKDEAKQAIDNLVIRYPGLALLQEEQFPLDARRGWFVGLDGRKVRIPGDTESYRKHLAMSGYLQNGEAVAMKLATLKWENKLAGLDAKLVNFVHDEWQVECPNNMAIALQIAKMMSKSLEEVTVDLSLHCPLTGSYYNDDVKDYTIDCDWSKTH